MASNVTRGEGGQGNYDDRTAGSPLSGCAQQFLESAPPSGIPVPITRLSSPIIRAIAHRRSSSVTRKALQRSRVQVRTRRIADTTVSELTPSRLSTAHSADEPYLVYVHGGAFILGRPIDRVGIDLADGTGLLCHSIHYALAPDQRFPIPLNDVDDAWSLLTTSRQGRPVLIGVSAGGNLALGLLQRLLRRSRDGEPVVFPAAVVLVTPASDLRPMGGDRLANEGRDPLIKWHGLLDRAYAAYSPALDRNDPEVSPVLGDYTGLQVPVMVTTAEHDLFRPDILALVRALESARVPVRLDDASGLWHSYQQFDLDEAASGLRRMCSFITDVLGRT